MAVTSQALACWIQEFRIHKVESLKKDLHKLTPDELQAVKEELDLLLGQNSKGETHG